MGRYDGGRRWIMNWRDEVVWASAAAGLVLQPRTVVPLSWRVAAQLIGSCLWRGVGGRPSTAPRAGSRYKQALGSLGGSLTRLGELRRSPWGWGWTRTTRCPCWAREGTLEEGKWELWIKKGQVQLRFAPGGRVLATKEQTAQRRLADAGAPRLHDPTCSSSVRCSRERERRVSVRSFWKLSRCQADISSASVVCKVCRYVCGCGCCVERWEYTVFVGRSRLQVRGKHASTCLGTC